MRSSKSKRCKAVVPEEECGVWLDAVELKAKKQRKLTQPISKLLNPLARSGGYSMAVALNFTQTKMEMPVTKQSRISSFFAAKSKKETVDCSTQWPSQLSSTPRPGACLGTKRKRERTFKLASELDDISGSSSLIEKQEYDVNKAGLSGEICTKAAADDKEQRFLHLIWGYQSDECEPAGEKRCKNIEIVTDKLRDPGKSIKTDKRSKEIPKSNKAQQQTHENFWMPRNVYGENCACSSPSLCKVEVKDQSIKERRASFLTPSSDTEIQNNLTNCLVKFSQDPELIKQRQRLSSVELEDKENRPSSITLSPFNQHVRATSAKCALNFDRKFGETPMKSIRDSPEYEDSLDMLFTQDSEGFRVISHRGKQFKCPLKDQTNSCVDIERSSSLFVLPLNTQESPGLDSEVLFTQDSQGNIVIKH